MMKIVAFFAISTILISCISCGVIRDQDNYLLGNERISKRSLDDGDNAVASSSDDTQKVEEPHVVYRRSIRSDEYRQHDDLLMSIVPKAIFGERILKRFVDTNVFAGLDSTRNVVFKPQFILHATTLERKTVE